MNLRFRTAKPLEKNTFVLITNQQQIDGVSKKLLPLKTGPYLIIDKPTETTYILKAHNKEHITIHRNPNPTQGPLNNTISVKRKQNKNHHKINFYHLPIIFHFS